MEDAFKGLGCVFVMAIVGVVCGTWKAIEIVIWLYDHVSVSWQ